MFQYIKTWATTTTTILWLIVLIQVSQAQTSTLTPAYSLKKGLPSSTINHIAEDTNSGIWIATENGLKILNQPDKEWLEKRMLGKSVIQIGFLDNYVFAGCRDSLLIIDQKTKRIVQAYSKQALGGIIKIKKLQNTIWIVTQNAVFKWVKDHLTAIPYNPTQGTIFDVTSYHGKIVAVTYPQGKIETLDANSFVVDEILTKKANPKHAPLLTIAAKNDTLAIGGDGFYSVYANGTLIDKNSYPLRNDIKYNYAVWDIAFVDDIIYFGIGDTHNLINGGIITAFPLLNRLPAGSPYFQTLYYQKTKRTLWIGSLYDGVFLIKNLNESIFHNGLKYQPGLNQQSFYLYNGENTFAIENGKPRPIHVNDTRLIATIKDTTYILSYTNLTIIPKKGKKYSTISTPTEGRLYTHAQRLGDSLYAFALYKPTTIFDLKTLNKNSVSQNKIITSVEKQYNFIISHNQGIGFTMYTPTGNHPVTFKKDNRIDIDDFTTNSNNEIITLSENKINYYALQNNLTQLSLTKQFDFTKHFKDYTPRWIVHGNKNTLYAISEKGIVVMQKHLPVYFIEINDIKITNKPFIDPYNRLVIQHENTTRLLPLKQAANQANQVNTIAAPEKILEKDPIQINVLFNKEALAPSQLQKIEILHDNKKIYEKYTLEQTIIIDTLPSKGQYQLKVYSNNHLLYNKKISIEIPWQQNPLFRISILLLIMLALFLFFKNRYNQKMYAKKLINNRLELIQQNLNPHFVFNSLNLIYSSILQDKKEEALQTVRDFSTLHRSFLERSKEKQVSIASELGFIESYLAIESMRFQENIAINHILTIDPNCNTNAVFIPPNILQPLIENAIKYGILGYQGTEIPVIYIDVHTSKQQVTISIENAIGESIDLYKGTGMGLSIVTERLKLFNQENKSNIQFQTSQVSKHFNKGYRVAIEINL
jgi:two-component sensor histidine kinase